MKAYRIRRVTVTYFISTWMLQVAVLKSITNPPTHTLTHSLTYHLSILAGRQTASHPSIHPTSQSHAFVTHITSLLWFDCFLFHSFFDRVNSILFSFSLFISTSKLPITWVDSWFLTRNENVITTIIINGLVFQFRLFLRVIHYRSFVRSFLLFFLWVFQKHQTSTILCVRIACRCFLPIALIEVLNSILSCFSSHFNSTHTHMHSLQYKSSKSSQTNNQSSVLPERTIRKTTTRKPICNKTIG